LEVKRQCIIDLQRDPLQAEQKSNDRLVDERKQHQRSKAQTFDEAFVLLNRPEKGPEVGCCSSNNNDHEDLDRCSSDVGIVHAKRLKHVRAAIKLVTVVRIVNIAIGKCIRECAVSTTNVSLAKLSRSATIALRYAHHPNIVKQNQSLVAIKNKNQ
jgi:hypothetical protein